MSTISSTGSMTMPERRREAERLGITVNELYHLQQDRELEKALNECRPKVLPRKKKVRAEELVVQHPFNFGDTCIGPIYKGSNEEHTTMNTF